MASDRGNPELLPVAAGRSGRYINGLWYSHSLAAEIHNENCQLTGHLMCKVLGDGNTGQAVTSAGLSVSRQSATAQEKDGVGVAACFSFTDAGGYEQLLT